MLKRFGLVAVTVFTIAAGCGGDDSADGGKGGGGASGSSGASAKGGAAPHGGAGHGGSASGGTSAMGGMASGGAGVPPTDAGAGGLGTGGSVTRGGSGGVGEGGTDEGGAPAGGQVSTGGTNGGVANGGADANGGGGSANGGSTNGGSANGGSTNGGSANGGSANGGSASGGTGAGGKASLNLSLDAPANTLALDGCGATPAIIPDVAAGAYDLELTASNLSKGTVSDENDQEFPSFDDYVIVNLPLPPGDANEKQRFFMLHGVSDSVSITLPAAGSIKLYFVDSDAINNSGQATVTLKPTGTQATVDATANVIAWRSACSGSAPATISLSKATQRVTLVSSTFSSATQAQDPFVLLRLNNEMQVNDHRFTILNGIGASYTFTPYANSTMRAWFISANGGGTGSAQLKIEEH